MKQDVDWSEFSYSWTVLIVFVLFFLLTAQKDLSIFVKINTFGVIFTIINISIIVGVGIYGMIDKNVNY
jgi:hypothetical protein